jgi:hypothetical protein
MFINELHKAPQMRFILIYLAQLSVGVLHSLRRCASSGVTDNLLKMRNVSSWPPDKVTGSYRCRQEEH